MSNKAQICQMVSRFDCILGSRRNILTVFHTYKFQAEGWLKGEFIDFLEAERTCSHLREIDREVKYGQGDKRIDIKLTLPDGSETWIELKHWFIGERRGTDFTAKWYLGNKRSPGLKPDVEKLRKVSGHYKYVLVLTTRNPGEDAWNEGISRFHDAFPQLHIKTLTHPNNFPNHYFLGLLMMDQQAQEA